METLEHGDFKAWDRRWTALEGVKRIEITEKLVSAHRSAIRKESPRIGHRAALCELQTEPCRNTAGTRG